MKKIIRLGFAAGVVAAAATTGWVTAMVAAYEAARQADRYQAWRRTNAQRARGDS